MTDETHITRLIFESEGGPEAEANAKKITDANQRVANSEEGKAATVEKAAQRMSAARKGVEDSYSREVAAAARDADVVAKSEKIKVEAITTTQRQINAIARRVDPLGTAYRTAADYVEKLNRTIASGVASGDSKKIDLANQAAEVLPAAIKYRDRAQQAMNVAASAPDNKLTAEQERLNKAAEKYLDIIDATRPATREYNAELAQIAELQAAGEMSALNAAIAEAKLTAEYEKKLHSLSGAAAAAKEQEVLNASVQKYRDQLDPTLPVMRAYAAELQKIEELKSKGKIDTPEARDILVRVTTDYTKKIAETNGSAEADRNAAKAAAEYQKQIEALRETIDPLAAAEKRRADAVSFANKALSSGALTGQEHAAALRLASSNYDKATEAAKKNAVETNASTKESQRMQFVLQNLSFQVNDVITSIGSGISPMRTFAQQGGQFFQVFQQGGGARNVLSQFGAQIGSWITPTKVAVAGLVSLGAAFGALLLRASSNTEQLRQFNLILEGTGKSSLTTAGNLQKTVRELRDLAVSKADAEAATSAIARNPRLNPAQSTRIATTGLDVAFRLGVKDIDGIKAWTDAIDGGVDSLVKLGFQMQALTVPEANNIRDLQRHGQALQATNQLIDIITKNIDGQHKKSLTDSAGAVNSLESAWRKFFDTLTDTGPLVQLNSFLKSSLQGWSEVLSGKSSLFDGLYGRSMRSLDTAIRSAVGAEKTPADSTKPPVDWRAQRNAAIPGGQSYPGSTATTVTNGATASAAKSFTVTGNAPLVNVDPDLVDTFEKTLIETGMRAVITSSTGGSHTFGSQHYTRNTITGKGEALDYNLIDAAGNLILHAPAHTKGSAAYNAYAQFESAFVRNSGDKGRSGILEFDDPGHVDFGRLSGVGSRNRPAAVTSDVAVRTPEQIDAAKKAYDDISQSAADATRNAKFYGVQLQANTAYTETYRQAINAQEPEWVAQQRAQVKYNEALALGSIELQKNIDVEETQIAASGKVAAASKVSEAAGYRAAAASEAEIEVKQRGVGNVSETTERKLREGAASAIRSSAQQAAAAQPQLVALEKLASATLKGTKAAHDQDLQNQAVLQTQDALAKAEATREPALIAEAKRATDAAAANIKLADSRRQSIAAAEAANDNKLTLQSTQLETTLTTSGLTTDQITRQLDYLKVAQDLNTKFRDASQESRDAYKDTSIAIADAKYQLTLAQREQEKWNNLVSDLANKIDSELTKSIDNAFSEDKVESWGKRINKWLGSLSSTLSSSLFIRPALGTVAGALGFGTVAQSLGSFSGLLGTGGSATSSLLGSSSSTTSGGDLQIKKNDDGTVSLSTVTSGASLFSSTNSLLGGTSTGFLSDINSGGLGGLFAHTPTAADFEAGVGPVVNAPGSLFGSTTLGSFAGASFAGLGAGLTLNSLLGGNKLGGTIGSGTGALAGAAIGSIFPGVGTLVGGLVGGAAGGGLGGLFGQTNKRANATGVSIDLSTGKASGFTSSGSAENDKTLKEIRDDISKFTTGLQSSTGGTTSGYINPQATDQGIKLDYNIPGFGAGIYNTKDSQEAIDNAELAIVKGLTGVSDLTQMVIDKYSGNIDDLKTALDAAADYKDTTVTDTVRTVIDKTSDPSKLADSLKFAKTYDKINDAAKDAFSSIPADLKITGPFEKAKDDIKTTFDGIEDTAKEFDLAIGPINDARDEANKRLKTDFNRNINDLVEAATDPLQSLVDIEKRAGDARVKEAEAVAGDIEAVNKLNAKNLDKIWTDQTASIQDLRDEFKTGDLSGLTDYQRLPAARTKYVDTLAAVQGGDTSKWDTLITDAKNLFSLSKGAYGEGPKTAEWRTAITAVLDNVLAGRTFAAGTKTTPPGTILVGEKGPELITQPGGLHVHTHNETERLLSSGAVAQTATVPDSKVAHLSGRPFSSGATGASPGVILVADRRLVPISHERSSRLHSSRDTERAISTLSTISEAASIASSNSSVVSNSSRSVGDGSSRISNQNIITAFTKTLPAQAITAGAADAFNGAVLVGPHGGEPMTLVEDRSVASGATATQPISVLPSSATSNLSVISDSSTAASDNSSSLSVQNITAAIERTAPSRAFAGGTEATPPGVIMVGEPIDMPRDHAFAAGTMATPPGTVLVGEKGPELVSQPGGLHVYTHRETEKILSAMPQVSRHGIATDDHRYKTPNVISLTVSKEGMVATPSFAVGVDSTPAGTILVGEKGPELIAQPGALHVYTHVETNKILASMSAGSNDNMPIPLGRSFADGTAGQYNNIVHLPTSISKPSVNGMIGQHITVSHLPMFFGGAFASGTIGQYANVVHMPMSPTRTFASGTTEQYTNTVHMPMSPVMSFANGTTGQNSTIAYMPISPVMSFAGGTNGQDDNIAYLPFPQISFSGASESRRGPDNIEVAKLLRDVVAAVKVNNNITRLGHLETGDEIRKQTTVIQKTTPHTPMRRRA